jgi:hypothetical protein
MKKMLKTARRGGAAKKGRAAASKCQCCDAAPCQCEKTCLCQELKGEAFDEGDDEGECFNDEMRFSFLPHGCQLG